MRERVGPGFWLMLHSEGSVGELLRLMLGLADVCLQPGAKTLYDRQSASTGAPDGGGGFTVPGEPDQPAFKLGRLQQRVDCFLRPPHLLASLGEEPVGLLLSLVHQRGRAVAGGGELVVSRLTLLARRIGSGGAQLVGLLGRGRELLAGARAGAFQNRGRLRLGCRGAFLHQRRRGVVTFLSALSGLGEETLSLLASGPQRFLRLAGRALEHRIGLGSLPVGDLLCLGEHLVALLLGGLNEDARLVARVDDELVGVLGCFVELGLCASEVAGGLLMGRPCLGMQPLGLLLEAAGVLSGPTRLGFGVGLQLIGHGLGPPEQRGDAAAVIGSEGRGLIGAHI